MQLIDVLVDYKVNRIYSLLWKKKKKHSKKVLRRQQQQLFYFKFYFFNAKQWMESSVYRQLEKQTGKKEARTPMQTHPFCKHILNIFYITCYFYWVTVPQAAFETCWAPCSLTDPGSLKNHFDANCVFGLFNILTSLLKWLWMWSRWKMTFKKELICDSEKICLVNRNFHSHRGFKFQLFFLF